MRAEEKIQCVENGPQAQLMMLNGTTEAQDLGRQSGNRDGGKPGQAIFRKSQLLNAAMGRCRTFLMETVTKPNMSAISPVAMGSALGELTCYLLCLTVSKMLYPHGTLYKAIRAASQEDRSLPQETTDTASHVGFMGLRHIPPHPVGAF